MLYLMMLSITCVTLSGGLNWDELESMWKAMAVAGQEKLF